MTGGALFYALLHLLFCISALRIIFCLPPSGYFSSVFRPAGRFITAVLTAFYTAVFNLKTILIFLDFSCKS